MKCARCHRPLKHAVNVAGMVLGSKCARMLYGAIAQRRRDERAPQKDERQTELFSEQPA